MRQIYSLIIAIVLFSTSASAQDDSKYSISTALGTAIPMTGPSCTPIDWHITGNYNINRHISCGIGTGLSIYEKAMIPFYGNIKYYFSTIHKLSPFVDCNIGYAFATSSKANGGFYLNPNIGIRYKQDRHNFFLALGYNLQEMKRLREQQQSLYNISFEEHLSHNAISVKIGYAIDI